MAAAIGLAIGAIFSGLSGASGKRRAKRARNAEINRIRLQTAEEIRRRTGAFNQDFASGRALAGASGFAMGPANDAAQSGGFGKVLEEMQKEFTREIDWLNLSAQSGIDVTNQAYKSTASGINFDTAKSVIGSVDRFGQAKNWWV